jgi:hypothetical protein
MKDLIERLEKATRPDSDLGRAVLLACGWRKTIVGYYMGPQFRWSSPDGKIDFDDDYFHRHDPTRSLDVAAALVPEGLAWTLGQNVHHRYWQASVNNLDEDGRPQAIGYSGLQGNRTAPIALCIAALKARADGPQSDMEAGR